MPVATVPIPQWTKYDVAAWARSIGEADLADVLMWHCVTGEDLQTLTDQELQVDLDVENAEQRTRFLEQIRRIQDSCRAARRLQQRQTTD